MLLRVSFFIITFSLIGCGSSSGSSGGGSSVNTSLSEAETLGAEYSKLMAQTQYAIDFSQGYLDNTGSPDALANAIEANCQVVEDTDNQRMLQVELVNGSGTCPVSYVNTTLVTSSSQTSASARMSSEYRLLDSALASQYEVQAHECNNSTSVRQQGDQNSTIEATVNCTTTTRTKGTFTTKIRVQMSVSSGEVSISSNGTISNNGKTMSFNVVYNNGGATSIKINGQQADNAQLDGLASIWQGIQ
jgi:hypothetical protein